MQSHSIKPHLKNPSISKDEDRFEKQITTFNSSRRRGLDYADILISGAEETHLLPWLATRTMIWIQVLLWCRQWYRTEETYFQWKTKATLGVRWSVLQSSLDLSYI